jgi:hypothetical protein
MRQIVALLVCAGCHDYAHFSTRPGCVTYTFDSGIPAALQAIDPPGDASVQATSSGLHVSLPAGASHDFWVDNLDAFRVEERQPRSGAFAATARVHGALDQTQKFSGLYASEGDRFIAVQTSADGGGLHDHDIVFSFGASGEEQGQFPDAAAAPGDEYHYGLSRDNDSFTLTGSDSVPFTVTAGPALNVGVVLGSCCDINTPAFDATIEWLMICQ